MKKISLALAIGTIAAGHALVAENIAPTTSPANETPTYLKQDKPVESATTEPTAANFPRESEENRNARMAWWRDARGGNLLPREPQGSRRESHRHLPQFKMENGCTSIPLEFDPNGSMFVVFRKPTTATAGEGSNFPSLETAQTLEGPWTVQFDKEWFYPTAGLTGEAAEGKLVFEKLEDWTKRPEDAVKHFSGTATYQKTFQVSGLQFPVSKVFLDLGTVGETAKITLNGKDLGVVWCAPRRVDITEALKSGDNELKIEVVNNWPNRLIGDGKLSADQRRTKTNINKYNPPKNGEHALQPAGLLGPVSILIKK